MPANSFLDKQPNPSDIPHALPLYCLHAHTHTHNLALLAPHRPASALPARPPLFSVPVTRAALLRKLNLPPAYLPLFLERFPPLSL